MAKRIRHTTRNTRKSNPHHRTMHVNTTSLNKIIREEKLKAVRIEPTDNLYLGGILYKGEAFLKPNGRFIVQEPTITSNKYVDLINKNPDNEPIASRRILSRKMKASLSTTRGRQKNIREKIRLENKMKSNRGRNNKFVKKISRRRVKK